MIITRLHLLAVLYFVLILLSTHAIAEAPLPDLTNTPWEGMSFPPGTKIKVEEQNNGKFKKFLILPSGFWIYEKDTPLEICEKQCWAIGQDLTVNGKKLKLTRTDKLDSFEPHIRRLSAISTDNDLEKHRKYFTDKGWESYKIYAALVKKLFNDILADGFESGIGFIEGAQKYYYRGKGDYLSFHGFGRFAFRTKRSASDDTDGGLSLSDRALIEIYVDFLPKPNSEEGYIIDQWETQIYLKKW